MPLLDKTLKELLVRKRVELVENIDLNYPLWNEMISRGVITEAQKDAIIKNDQNIHGQQKTLLLELLPKLTQERFVEFCHTLDATKQSHIIDDVLELDRRQLNLETGEQCQSESPQKMEVHDTPATSGLTQPLTDPPHEREGEDIELTDEWEGEPDRVNTTTPAFYLQHRDPLQAYPMHLPCRGLCLIINVSRMAGTERKGTELDGIRLAHLFQSLHFKIIPYEDKDGLTADGISQKVQDFYKRPDHRDYQCSVMILLSHGGKDCIYGTDGVKVMLYVLYKVMDGCPGLASKPKLVFLQSCDGSDLDDGTETTSILAGEDEEDAKNPFMADTFIGRPSQPGMSAHRNTLNGSWYIQAIVKVFSKYAATQNLSQLINKVNSAVSKKESKATDPRKAGKKQMPTAHYSLRRDLYFFPGIQQQDP